MHKGALGPRGEGGTGGEMYNDTEEEGETNEKRPLYTRLAHRARPSSVRSQECGVGGDAEEVAQSKQRSTAARSYPASLQMQR